MLRRKALDKPTLALSWSLQKKRPHGKPMVAFYMLALTCDPRLLLPAPSWASYEEIADSNSFRIEIRPYSIHSAFVVSLNHLQLLHDRKSDLFSILPSMFRTCGIGRLSRECNETSPICLAKREWRDWTSRPDWI